jgi:dephospho-CoA kinase
VKREGEQPAAPEPVHPGIYVIGLTGNIATGKSTVAAMLAQLGAQVIDADALAHQVMRAGTPAWHQIVERFGREILEEDGEIDRSRLGAQAFADPAAMACLEAIVHPAVIAEAERLLQAMQESANVPASCGADRPVLHRRSGRGGAPPAGGSDSRNIAVRRATCAGRVAVLEAIKLIESGMHHHCNELWVVTCPREQQVQRLMQTRNLSQREAELRIDAQPPQQEKLALASTIIDNGADPQATRAQVEREWERVTQAQQRLAAREERSQGGSMAPSGNQQSILRSCLVWVDEHPFLSMWAILAVGMVAIFLITARDVDLLPTQRLFMAVACVALAGLCTWVVSWE